MNSGRWVVWNPAQAYIAIGSTEAAAQEHRLRLYGQFNAECDEQGVTADQRQAVIECVRLRSRIEAAAVRSLPGYEEAAWELRP